ncbi:hypothetical protein CDO24_32170 (plasmid) [Sinorhizobium meliloti]|nr:hypothetical protein CDO24_32170 [Sinorhizobium meliloti]
MTTAPPPAHYGAVKGALASGFATAELHHLWGHDPSPPRSKRHHGPKRYIRIVATSTAGCTGKVMRRSHIPKVTGVYAFNQLDP